MKTLEVLPHLKKYTALASYPLADCIDGTRDLIIRKKNAPTSDILPLYDHHDYAIGTIGACNITYIPCAEYSQDEYLCFITALIHTDKDLPRNQPVSIGAPLEKSIGKYRIYHDIIEVSIVDVGHSQGAMIMEVEDLVKMLNVFSEATPFIIPKILKELNGTS